jgi:hypothetical protein
VRRRGPTRGEPGFDGACHLTLAEGEDEVVVEVHEGGGWTTCEPMPTRSGTRRPRLGISGGQVACISGRGHPQAEVGAGVRVAGRGVPAAAAEPCSSRIHRFRTAN